MPRILGNYGTMYFTDNMKKTVDYYKNVGFKVKMESPEWTEFDLGGSSLCFHSLNGQKRPHADGGILITKVEGLTALVEDLKTKGVEFTGPIKEIYPGAHSAEFLDPEGNRVSLYEDTNKY